MISEPIERCLRAFVSDAFDQSSGLNPGSRRLMEYLNLQSIKVIPGNESAPRERDPYASLLLMTDVRAGYPWFRREGTNTLMSVIRKSVFSLQFYRKGADSLAKAFDSWAMSENGLIYAQTGFADGRIEGLRILSGGAGYTQAPTVSISGDGSGAAAEADISNGRVSRIRMTDFGSEYTFQPLVSIEGDGSGAEASAYGSGFAVKFPLIIKRLDALSGDQFEKRAQIDLEVHYNFSEIQSTGLVDSFEGSLCLDPGSEEQISI